MKPYNDTMLAEDLRVRSFEPKDLTEESTWHRDERDRSVFIVESEGWKFQREDEMPTHVYPGDVIEIQSHTWHRVLPGSGKLVALIKER